MSKSKKNKNTRVSISPENYIRKRARNLPVVKCLINKDWNRNGMANIFIVRQHASGKFTFCVYLVDKDCLGVKDSFFKYNVSPAELDECIESGSDVFDTEEVSYELVHNIIFAALEFAEEYGFKPHKQFTSVTQYFLEEDTDAIPIIEIHCGRKDGKPRYVNSGYESPAQSEKIIRQLEKTAGQGNFEVLMKLSGTADPNGDLPDDDDETDEFYEAYSKKIMKMSKKNLEKETFSVFMDYLKNNMNNYRENPELSTKATVLAEFWREKDNVLDGDLSDEYLEMMKESFTSVKTVESNAVPNSLFPGFTTDGEGLEYDFVRSFMMVNDRDFNKEDVEKQIGRFARKHGDCGASTYLKFIYNDGYKVDTFPDLERELERFSDYFLILLMRKDKEITGADREEVQKQLMALVEDRTLTPFEMMQFIMCYMVHVFDVMNNKTDNLLEKTNAFVRLLKGKLLNYSDYTTEMMFIFAKTRQMDATIIKVLTQNFS